MRSILFYPDVAEDINKRVQEKIASHLFVVANYNPEAVYAFSTDAKFSKAVNNLYKFIIDAGIIKWFSKIRDRFDHSIPYDYRTLNKHINLISMLRSVEDHNFSDKNGTDDNNRKYRQWLIRVSGKETITCAEDFEKPLDELEKIGNEIVEIVYEFINNASRANDRSTIVAKWEGCIWDFYNSTNGNSIVKAQLMIAYKSRVNVRNIAGDQLERYIITWCKKMFIDQKEAFIQTRQALIARLKDVNAIDKIAATIREKESEISETKHKVALALYKGDITRINDKSYYIYYTKHFGDRMSQFLEQQNGYEQTLLPQDIVADIIENDFNNIQAQ